MVERAAPLTIVPSLPIGDLLETGFTWFKDTFDAFFDVVGDIITGAIDGLAGVLLAPEPLVLTVIFALLAWLVRDWKLGIGTLVGMVLIIGMGMWDPAMDTLALVVVATLVALIIGVPLGILAARSAVVSRILRPVMDFLQTMPGFVWLVPVVKLFSIGVAGAMVATVIFAVAPAVRLTELGIRQVDSEVVEAGQAFGAGPRQILKDIQLPLALPTVMAGVNQVIMLSLSMAVIGGLVGAGGLGNEVVSGISTLNLALGFDAGISVVILAIFLDRLTASIGSRRPGHGRMRELRERFTRTPAGSAA
ncbi:ABC transporter permease [Promicromonospora iranensis]|uniref:Glycine betaine/proline transport system permease protein n=1 Tax=Promicromonospora iranensis TaxID=1105144 RepID=A0ABU2CSI8_9MICO|nr:ABC transporter permease subunit [Promicromonospora iranensis]MDR7384299.1 glycine betaine/proline transport system permease protein [Promicromonospora iranensis]